jgi:signal transduction histidine kinase
MRKLAETVNTLVDRLNSLEKSRRQLLANLVHELGTPLGAIRSAIQALLKGANKDPQLSSDLLTGLDSETARLQRLLDDLAGLHDQVLGRLELNRQAVQLNQWLTVTLSPWETAAREKGLVWETEIPQELPDILLDSDRMAQAVGNLLSNAVKFTPAGGKITTTVKFMGEQLVIQMTDTGTGIPSEEQNKIFQPFYRGSHGRRIVQGMGLGLSIARDIIIAHGGTIDLQSAPGTGSQFTVRMPVDAPQD